MTMIHRNSSTFKKMFTPDSSPSSPRSSAMPANTQAVCRAASTGRLRKGDGSFARRSSLPRLLPRDAAARESSAPPNRAQQERSKFGHMMLRSQAKPAPIVKVGSPIRIENQSFDIIGKLGAGSFGQVWSAKSVSSQPIALKVIFCKSDESLDTALKECDFLRSLARKLPSSVVRQIPAVFALDVSLRGIGEYQVCLAMARIPGVPISAYLETQCKADRTWGCTELFNIVGKACAASRELLAQLAPAFENISKFVYHRDINPANVMIDNESESPCFGIIDFGLATDAASWRADVTSRVHRCHVVGNGCYWPTSSWLAFTSGSESLSKHPELCSEFSERLDLHALGVMALQMVAETVPPSCEFERRDLDRPDGSTPGNIAMSKLLSLQQAWSNYWSTTHSAWRRIIRTSATDREKFDTLRSSLRCLGMHKIVQKDLKRLLTLLGETSEACQALPHPHPLSEAPRLFDAISLMISSGQKSQEVPSWRKIQNVIGESDAQPNLEKEGHAGPRKESKAKAACPVTPSSEIPSSFATSCAPSDASTVLCKDGYSSNKKGCKWTGSRGALWLEKAVWLECDPCHSVESLQRRDSLGMIRAM